MWLVLFVTAAVTEAAKCRAIALAGGGSYGAYEVGAFKGLVHSLSADDIAYNVATGISAGSLNAAALAEYAMGSEVEASDFLVGVWENLQGEGSIFREWPGGYLTGLLVESGMLNTQPLNELLHYYVSSIERNVTVGATNLNDGSYAIFDETDGEDGLVQGAMASSAIPVVFQTQKFGGEVWVDGGVTYGNDIGGAVTRCLDVTGGKQEDIIVDMVSCGSPHLASQTKDLNSINAFTRQNDIQSYTSSMDQLFWAMDAFPDVFFRYYVEPRQGLPGSSALDFGHDVIMKTIDIGYDDAKYYVANNIYASDVLAAWRQRPDIVYV